MPGELTHMQLPHPDDLQACFEKFIREKNESFESAIAASAGYNDVYKAGEWIIRDMMNVFFGLNLKMEGECNAAGFDLRDEKNNVLVQVTHNHKGRKVDDCLKTTSNRVAAENLGKPKLYIVFLDKKPLMSLIRSTRNKIDEKRYSFAITVDFQPETDILNLDSFIGMLRNRHKADRTGLGNEDLWKIVAFLQSMGCHLEIPRERGNSRFAWNPDAENNIFALSDLKAIVESLRKEQFASDWEFMERLIPERIRTDLQIDSTMELRRIMEGYISVARRKAIYEWLERRADYLRGSKGLIALCKNEIPGKAKFQKYYAAVFEHLGDDGKYLHECARRVDWVVNPYLGVAMLALYAIMGQEYFEDLMDCWTENTIRNVRSVFSS